VAMFSTYFDSSGHPDDTDVLTVAGFVADINQWIEFERNWKAILERADFQVSGLHMKEFCHSTGEFSAWKGDERRRRNFLSALIGIIKCRMRHSFAQSIYLPAYHEVDKVYELCERAAPFVYCGTGCIAKVQRWAQRWRISQNDLAYFFEDGDKDKHKLKAETEKYGINIHFMKKCQSVAFQAADLLAYENFRANQKLVPRPGVFSLYELRHPLQELMNVPNGDEGSDWGITDRTNLEQFCADQNIPRR